MKCPFCLSKWPPLPWQDKRRLPLLAKLFVSRVRCDACLAHFYRVRLLGWLIPIKTPSEEDSHV